MLVYQRVISSMISVKCNGHAHFHPINHHDSPIVSRKCPSSGGVFPNSFFEVSSTPKINELWLGNGPTSHVWLLDGVCIICIYIYTYIYIYIHTYTYYVYVYIVYMCIYIYMITEHTQSYTYIIILYTCMISWLIFRRIWVILEHYLKYSELGKKTRKVNTPPKEQTTIVTLYG